MLQPHYKRHAGAEKQRNPKAQLPVEDVPEAAVHVRRAQLQIDGAEGTDERCQQHQQHRADRGGGHERELARPSRATPPITSAIPPAFQTFIRSWKKYIASRLTQT